MWITTSNIHCCGPREQVLPETNSDPKIKLFQMYCSFNLNVSLRKTFIYLDGIIRDTNISLEDLLAQMENREMWLDFVETFLTVTYKEEKNVLLLLFFQSFIV